MEKVYLERHHRRPSHSKSTCMCVCDLGVKRTNETQKKLEDRGVAEEYDKLHDNESGMPLGHQRIIHKKKITPLKYGVR